MRQKIFWRLHGLAYPAFDCEGCMRSDRFEGCLCQYYGFYTPCVPPGRGVQLLRRFLLWAFPRETLA